MAEKTEKATPKKLRDARRKGQVAKSQDFPSAITFIVSMCTALVMAGYFFEQIAGFTLTMFKAVATSGADFENLAGGFFMQGIQTILHCSLPIMGFVAIVGVLVNFLIIGPIFSFESLKFDLKKLNPIDGLKQKFKLKVLVELIKSCLKISGAALIIFMIIWNALPSIISTVVMPAQASLQVVSNFLLAVTVRVGVFFLMIAIFDLFFQRQQFAKEMKMEKFEVKQEYKDTEGDPHIKGKRKEIAREIAYQDGPKSARRARAIITNPTHLAVAIKYNPEEEPAPIILTMGAGFVAEQIIKIGLENKVPIMRNVDLARELYTKGTISHYVPEDTYDAIAEVLKWIKSLEDNPDINRELLS